MNSFFLFGLITCCMMMYRRLVLVWAQVVMMDRVRVMQTYMNEWVGSEISRTLFVILSALIVRFNMEVIEKSISTFVRAA